MLSHFLCKLVIHHFLISRNQKWKDLIPFLSLTTSITWTRSSRSAPNLYYLNNLFSKHTRFCRSKETRRSMTPCAIKRALDAKSSRLLIIYCKMGNLWSRNNLCKSSASAKGYLLFKRELAQLVLCTSLLKTFSLKKLRKRNGYKG